MQFWLIVASTRLEKANFWGDNQRKIRSRNKNTGLKFGLFIEISEFQGKKERYDEKSDISVGSSGSIGNGR